MSPPLVRSISILSGVAPVRPRPRTLSSGRPDPPCYNPPPRPAQPRARSPFRGRTHVKQESEIVAGSRVVIVGGGLAGAESAWQAARRGLRVDLYEMRPVSTTPVHATGDLAELVCSNSLKSNLLDTASGLL